MSCAKCGHQNPAAAKFCMNCGAPQAAAPAPRPAPAPAEGSELEARLRRLVPPELLSKLSRAQSGGAQGERRTVTILFCDVKGSTAAAETMDPEEWADLMNGV